MKRSAAAIMGVVMAMMFLAGGMAGAAPIAEWRISTFKVAADDIFAKWSDSSLTANSSAFGSLWDMNAVKMANGRQTVSGQANIQEMRRQKDGAVIYDKFDVKIEEYQIAGDFGWVRGIYSIVTRPRSGGDPSTDIGTFLTVLKKQADGTWKVYRDTMMTLPKLRPSPGWGAAYRASSEAGGPRVEMEAIRSRG